MDSDFRILGKSNFIEFFAVLHHIAIDDGQRGIAITDHGNMFGVKDFVNHCAKVNKGRAAEGLEPVKPIIGCEVYVAPRKKTASN